MAFGKEANRGSFPWMATLWTQGYDVCGGTVIGPTTILTAGRPQSHILCACTRHAALHRC